MTLLLCIPCNLESWHLRLKCLCKQQVGLLVPNFLPNADFQAVLAALPKISPFSPVGPTMALTFVVLVAAIKAIIEDIRRHKEDNRMNNSAAYVVNQNGRGGGLKQRQTFRKLVWHVQYYRCDKD